MVKALQNTGKTERNHCIDLLRGLCLIFIILNHTCFNSGDNYVPQSFAQFSMLIDIPALFFVSGMTYSYVGRNILAGSLLKLSLSFTLVSIIINLIMGNLTWLSVFMPLVLRDVSLPEAFHCLQVSYWFVPVYAVVIIWATIILERLKPLYPFVIILCLGAYFLQFFMGVNISGFVFWGVLGQQIWFYLALFLFGYLFYEKIAQSKNKNFWAVFCIIWAIGIYILTYAGYGSFIFNIMMNKFPPKLPYVALSFVSIGAFMWYYKPERKNKLLEHIGQNALFYYIGQGVGSSLLYYVVDYVNASVYIKLPLMFMLNLVLTTLSAEILKFIYEGIGRGYRWCVKHLS